MIESTQNQDAIMRTEDDKTFYTELGQRIADARSKSGLTQAVVAKQLGVGSQTYAHYESGRLRTPIWHLRRIAEILELPYDTLIDGVPYNASRDRRGPKSHMEQLFLKASELPRPKQKMIQELLEAMLQKEAG